MSGFVSVDTFVIQFVILLLVLWVLRKFIFIPYLAYLDKWEDKQKKLEDDYKNIDALVAGATEEKDSILADARKKSDEIISEAETIAKNKKNSIIEKAEGEAKDIVESGKKEVEKEKLSMLSDVKGNIVNLVLKFNKKLFGKETVSADFVENEIELMK
ncbi:ATP synthase F0 subunit B [Candidatus Gracilibacteria bacterium]|nr:ATP synthase F0 subunit B [Candidatus Gracilibacteria bacterium]